MGSRDSRYQFVVLIGSVTAAFPWLVGVSYSKGNDIFYWLHFGWLVKRELATFRIPAWTMLSGCGQPVFNIDHIPDAIALALLSVFGGGEVGLRLFVVLCYILGSIGTYRLATDLMHYRFAALVATMAFWFSWYVTRTADYFVYTSNLLQLALLPWIVFVLRRAIAARTVGYHVAAALLISACILANPQTALKVVGLAVAWVVLEWFFDTRREDGFKKLGKTLGLVGGIALVFVAFHIVTALVHRSETFLFEQRGRIIHQTWQVFFLIPEYLANTVFKRFDFEPPFALNLWQVIGSHYWGFSVLGLSLFSVGRFKGRKKIWIRVLWCLTALSVLASFVSSYFYPSEWIGAPRKMFMITAFCAALLCGFGSLHLVAWARQRGANVLVWKVGILFAVLLELGGLKYAFYQVGTYHTPMEEIPHVEYWKEFSAGRQWAPGERFYTLQSDLAFMLYPSVTGRPTANRIHQRDYTAEFRSFQDTLNWVYFYNLPPYEHKVSECLALMNIGYVDLPWFGFSGRFAPRFTGILDHFQQDPDLQEVGRRKKDARDRLWQRSYGIIPKEEVNLSADGESPPAQVIFRNRRARFCFIPDKTIAIVGSAEAGQRLFERIALSSDFVFDRVLYLVAEDVDNIVELADAIDGAVGAESTVALPLFLKKILVDDINAFYREPATNFPQPELKRLEDYEIEIEVPSSSQGRFLFVSLQRFADWYAYDQSGRKLKVLKAGAGMTAVHLSAGCQNVILRYEAPSYKTYARIFSFSGLLICLGLWAIPAVRRKRV